MAIGLFDSGIGGLSILREIIKILPNRPYFYIADQSHGPYGPQSQDYIIERSCLLTEELLSLDCELIVVACNTATGAAMAHLRQHYPIPFVGVEPYLNFHNKLGPGNHKLVALMTPACGESEKYQNLKKIRDPQNQIEDYACPQLAWPIEKAYQQGYSEVLIEEMKRELDPLKGQGFTHAILGCTHYPLIATLIENYLGLLTVSPGPSVAQRVHQVLDSLPERGEKIPAGKEFLPDHFFFQSTLSKNWQLLPFQHIEGAYYRP
ncbi:MAG: glutamate racemase [Pseudomonadota bacterium]